MELGKILMFSDYFGTLFIIVVKAILPLYFPDFYYYNAGRERG
jgi:hypothetical protein